MAEDNRISLTDTTSGDCILKLDLADNGTSLLRIIEEIGRGGSCIAYRATVMTNGADAGHEMIVKEFYPLPSSASSDISKLSRSETELFVPKEQSAAFRKREERFIKGASRFGEYYEWDKGKHSTSVPYYGRANGTSYIVSHLAGEHLLSTEPPRDINSIAQIMKSVCKAVESFHNNGVLYLDCKPSNLYWYEVDGTLHARLFDFDTAESLAVLASGQCEYVSCSTSWASPEQTDWASGSSSAKALSTATDAWSVGAVFFWLITGREPTWKHGTGTSSDSDLLKEGRFSWDYAKQYYLRFNSEGKELAKIEAIARKTLCKDPASRCQSMSELVKDFGELCSLSTHDATTIDAIGALLRREGVIPQDDKRDTPPQQNQPEVSNACKESHADTSQPKDREAFSTSSRPSYAVFNSLIDNASIGDERSFIRIREVGAIWYQNEIEIEPDKDYEVCIFYCNDADPGANTQGYGVATNTRVYTQLPSTMTLGNHYEIEGAISWSYVRPPDGNNPISGRINDSVIVHPSTDGLTLKYMAASARIHNTGKANDSILPTSIFSSSGTPIGHNKLTGTIPAGDEYSGYVVYHLHAEVSRFGSVEQTKLSAQKVNTPWGPNRPVFSWAERAPYATINSIIDNPGVGDERNFVQIRDIIDQYYQDEVELESGHTYEVYIYYHNDADPEAIGKKAVGIADGLAVRSSFPAVVKAGKKQSATATIFASDTNPIAVWDGAFMYSNHDLYLHYIPGTATIHNGGDLNGQPIGPDYLFGGGALLGYNKFSGLLPGGNEYAGYITYQLYASKLPSMTPWGPNRTMFTMESPATYPSMNSIKNNPTIGDERSFVRIGEIQKEKTDLHDGEMIVRPGSRYLVHIYCHNASSASFFDEAHDYSGAAQGVHLSCEFPEIVSPTKPGLVRAIITGENTNPKTVWSSVTLLSEQDVVVELEGPARIYNDWKLNRSSLPMDVFTDAGTPLGMNEQNGVLFGDESHCIVMFVLAAEAKESSNDDNQKSDLGALSAAAAKRRRDGQGPSTSPEINEHLRATYLGHSGFLLETPEATLLFDWHKGELPPIRQDKPLYVFVSHIHSDHFRWESFNLAAQHPNAQIFLGYDYSHPELNDSLSKLPEFLKDRLSCFKDEQKLYSDDGKALVSSLESTDLGVAFLVEVDGRRFYHAGDLALWTRPEGEYVQQFVQAIVDNPEACIPNYEGYRQSNLDNFRRCIEPLRGQVFDFGMLPLDPNLDEMGIETVEEYMAIAEFRTWSPMHLWEKYEYVDRYVIEHPENAKKMIGPASTSGCKKSVKPGEWFELS